MTESEYKKSIKKYFPKARQETHYYMSGVDKWYRIKLNSHLTCHIQFGNFNSESAELILCNEYGILWNKLIKFVPNLNSTLSVLKRVKPNWTKLKRIGEFQDDHQCP